MTLQDLILQLKNLDEVTLIEVLDLHSDEIVDQFEWLIEEKYEQIVGKVDDPRGDFQEEPARKELQGYLTWEAPDKEAFDFDSEE